MTNSATLNAPVNRKAPYEDTEVHYTTTKAQIECLLKTYGVKGVRWTSVEGQDDVLEFVVEVEVRGAKKAVGMKVSPPHIFNLKRVKGFKDPQPTENINQEYRLLFYWLKSKIEAVSWGLTSIEKEFLSDIVARLPDGRESSVGEMVTTAIVNETMPSLPFYQSTASPNAPQAHQRLPTPKNVTGQ